MLSGRPDSWDAAGGRYIARGAAPMPVRIFLSTVSDEFRDYRDQLRRDLTRHNVEVKVQEEFKDYGGGEPCEMLLLRGARGIG
jgi:hypothetical protein